MMGKKFIPLSETALLISFGDVISLEIHEQVMEVQQLIEHHPFKGFIETVPAYNSLAVYYDPLLIEPNNETIASSVEQSILSIIQTGQKNKRIKNTHLITIPVCYDQEFGIDLIELSASLQLSVEEITQLHRSKTYQVFMTGFSPGFPYMGTVDDQIITKRKSAPRTRVEVGSVAIAGTQTGIYPQNTPGGWNIIGKTPLKLFNMLNPNPFLLKAGDHVKFEAITKKEFHQTPSVVVNPDGGLKK